MAFTIIVIVIVTIIVIMIVIITVIIIVLITVTVEVDSCMSDYFTESGYKFILAVGLLVGENSRLKTVCAERGGLAIVLECLKQRKRSSSVCKWGLWALMVSISTSTFYKNVLSFLLLS